MNLSTTLAQLKSTLLKLSGIISNMTGPELVEQNIPVVAPVSRLPEFCTHVAAYEGANPANNNPLNFRYYFGGYLPKYGVVRESSGGFAMFETYELGWEYALASITQMVNNHPDWDFLDFFSVFAPSSDHNNPVLYSKTISSEMGVVVTSNVKKTLNI